MTTSAFIAGGRTDSDGRPTVVAEQVLEATAEDVDGAVRAANRAYWDHVAEVYGRRCSINWVS